MPRCSLIAGTGQTLVKQCRDGQLEFDNKHRKEGGHAWVTQTLHPKRSYSVVTAKQQHEMTGVFWFLGLVSI